MICGRFRKYTRGARLEIMLHSPSLWEITNHVGRRTGDQGTPFLVYHVTPGQNGRYSHYWSCCVHYNRFVVVVQDFSMGSKNPYNRETYASRPCSLSDYFQIPSVYPQRLASISSRLAYAIWEKYLSKTWL